MSTEALSHYQDPQVLAVAHEMSVEDVIARINKVHDVMQRAMKNGHHYGVIPGTGDKPTLLKPGAELLCVMFRLDPQYQAVADRTDGLTYTTTCTLWHIPTGQRMGSGMGTCSTRESKYAYRKGKRVCPSCGKDTLNRSKFPPRGAPRDTAPGWYCYAKMGGCGEEFAADDSHITDQPTGRVANEDVADQENTVLKMSNKRALVAAVLNVTAASDIFTQDLEDQPRDEPAGAPVMTESVPAAAAPESTGGSQSRTVAAKAGVVVLPTAPTADQRTFAEVEAAERGQLVVDILERKRALKLSDEDWEDYKQKRLGPKGTFQNCDLAALRDLKGDMGHAR